MNITIGTRGSKLALYQANLVAQRLQEIDSSLSIKIEIVKTTGDKFLNMSLSKSLDKGVFTKELEQMLLDCRIDIAVHSLKDLPTACTEGLTIGAILTRSKTEDVLIGNIKLSQLPPHSIVGTSSNRRAAQIRAKYPMLCIKPIRGNVETRIDKLDRGEYDALIMARAGIERLGMENRITEIIDEDIIVPAAGQGAIAVQGRLYDDERNALLRLIDDTKTRWEVEFERDLLSMMQGGCSQPLGCVCHYDNDNIKVKAFYANETFSKSIKTTAIFTKGERQEILESICKQFNMIGK